MLVLCAFILTLGVVFATPAFESMCWKLPTTTNWSIYAIE